MDRILKHNFNFGSNLPRDKFCDAKVRAKDSTRLIPIHRVILAAVSKKFEKMFEEKPETDIYMISEVKLETLDKIIEYIYTGQAVIAIDGEFWVGLVLLSINLGEVEVEDIKIKVETKPVVEEYFETETKLEIEEPVTSSSSSELTNDYPCLPSGPAAAKGQTSSDLIKKENLGQYNLAWQAIQLDAVDDGKSHSSSESLMINVEDVVVSDTTTDEDMAAQEKMKEMSPSEVATLDAKAGASYITFTDEMGYVVTRKVDREVEVQQAAQEKMKEVATFDAKAGGSYITYTDEMGYVVTRKVDNPSTSQRKGLKLAGMDVDSLSMQGNEAKKSTDCNPLKYKHESGGIIRSKEDKKFCWGGSVLSDQRIEIKTKSDNNDTQNMNEAKSFSSIDALKTVEKRYSCPTSQYGATEFKGDLGRRDEEHLLTMENQELVNTKTPQLAKVSVKTRASSYLKKTPSKLDMKIYPCTHKHRGCKEVFPEKTERQKHSKKCKRRPKSSFSCHVTGCTKRFYYEEDCRKHFHKYHPYE